MLAIFQIQRYRLSIMTFLNVVYRSLAFSTLKNVDVAVNVNQHS